MIYGSSYDSGRSPFKPDLQRGKWGKPTDFIFACCALCFKMDIFVINFIEFRETGIFFVLPYLFYMALYTVPLLVIHSFMGQFSSSGFISAFRLSPIFKGMGYVSVFLSIASLIFYAIFATAPLVFIFNSLRPTMPWSFEGLKEMGNLTTLYNVSDAETTSIKLPSVEYFNNYYGSLGGTLFMTYKGFNFSWSFVGFSVIIWMTIAYIFRNFPKTAKFGKLLRYMILTELTLLLVCLARFIFLPGALDGLMHYIDPDVSLTMCGLFPMILVLHSFGTGWGNVISLSSFNSFKTNIMSYSWIIAFGQAVVYILFSFITFILEHNLRATNDSTVKYEIEEDWFLYLSSASALARLEWANFWTVLFYSTLLIATLIVMITQIFTLLTSLFDEFEILRDHKEGVTFGLIGFLAFCFTLFCTNNHGVLFFTAVALDAIYAYSLMHLLLILAVLWIYGRERFQRDIEFMLGQRFASWKVFDLRFIAPLFLLFTMVVGCFEHIYKPSFLIFISWFLMIIPLLFIPGYGVYITYQNIGGFCNRLRRACRPTDWYPNEMEDRQKYDQVVGNSDLTNQLYELTEEVN